jgi:hypothetical protein
VQWIVQFWAVVVTQAAVGWVVARTHRAYPIPMVLAFLTFFSLWYVGANLYWIRMAFVDSIDQTRVRPYLAMFLMTAFTTILGNLLGAILAARARRYTV